MENKKYKSFSWIDPRIEIKKSYIEGRGMFAKKSIRAGEIIIIWGGIVVTKNQIKKKRIKVKKHSDVEIGEGIYLMDFMEQERGDLKKPDDSLLNHSCDPNLWMEDEAVISARRNIKKGEELTIDYAIFTTEIDHGLKECNCDSKLCRGNFSIDDWKLKELQKRYKDHFMPFINKKIKNINKEVK